MTAKVFDRVLLSSTTTGSGTYSLGSAATGFQDFGAAGAASGDLVAYGVVDALDVPTAWEIGEGIWTPGSPPTLTRATIIDSSSSGSPVSWPAGTRYIFSAPAAGKVLLSAGAALAYTPTDQSGAGLTFSNVNVRYKVLDELVTIYGHITYPATANGSAAKISLPLPVANSGFAMAPGLANTISSGQLLITPVQGTSIAAWGVLGTSVGNNALSGKAIDFRLTYPIA